ncbi:MAG: sensor histidine kinase [Hyphomicrobiales bacterium]
MPNADCSLLPDTHISRSEMGRHITSLVSHELRTPLNAIIGFADVLGAEGVIEEAQRREFAGYIATGGAELLGKINMMIDLARLEAGTYTLNPEILDPFKIANECCAVFLGEGEMFAEPGDVSGLRLRADRQALTLILTNLISNANKFSADDDEFSITIVEKNDGVEFVVADNGCGIDQTFLDAMGTPFLAGDMSYGRRIQGAGLGLAVVKGLVKLQNGKFSLTSTQHLGTKACVWLPSGLTAQSNMLELV